MFDGGSINDNEGDEGNDDAANAVAEADWRDLHHQLRSIAKRRIALEAKEAELLLEAEETRLYLRLGYTSMLEYMDRELNYGPHAANERLRVAHALVALPLTAELFSEGELCFSAVRELTRVATPATEEAFLREAQGKTAHEIQQMVAGLKPGDEPDAPPDPRRIKKRVVLELSVASYAAWRKLRAALENAASGCPMTMSSRCCTARPTRRARRHGPSCRPRSPPARPASRASSKRYRSIAQLPRG